VSSPKLLENRRLIEEDRLLWQWFYDSDSLEYLICVCVEFNSADFKRKGRQKRSYESFLVAWCLSQDVIHDKKLDIASKSIPKSVILKEAYPYYPSDIKTEGSITT